MSRLQTGRTVLFLGGVLAVGISTPLTVFAQQPAGAQGQGNLEEIVVTGSRIARRDFTSQSPIVTVDQSAFTSRSAVGLEATLDQLPQFNMTGAGSASNLSASSTPFPQANAAPGAATVNLRGLGLNRSLVLLDGRRAQPVNGYLVVDLNTIPAAAIDRVEVITGGAAAVYGADAIAGVVNFVLKKNFEGIAVDVRSAISEQGDGNESSVNGLLGATFADGRGSVMIGADYTKRDVIFSKDRDWVVRGWNDPGTTGGGLGSSNLSQLVTPAAPNGCGAAPPANGLRELPAARGRHLLHRSERPRLQLARSEGPDASVHGSARRRLGVQDQSGRLARLQRSTAQPTCRCRSSVTRCSAPGTSRCRTRSRRSRS